MVRDITLGQYFPGKSLIHKADPRIKIIFIISFIIFLFIGTNFAALISMMVLSSTLVYLSGIPIKLYLKSLKSVFFVVILTAVLNLFYGTGDPIFQVGFMQITLNGIKNSIFISIRIILMVLIGSLLTYTTSPTDITDALERLLSPLNKFKIRVHEFAMMTTIALRFIPTLIEEIDKIMNAQKSRGADMENGNIIKRIKALIPVMVPLFISSLRRANDLAIAMECRCYRGGENRTKMKILKIKPMDIYILIFTILVGMGVIACNKFLPTMAI